MSKKTILILALLFTVTTSWAQVNVEDDDNDEDEITVTDQSGNEEVIEFPEAMTYDLDSLLNSICRKTTSMRMVTVTCVTSTLYIAGKTMSTA